MNLDSSHSAMSSSSYPQNHTGDDQLDIEQQSSSKPYTLERVDSTGLPIPPPPPESPPIEKAANKMMPISINLMHNCNRNASNPQTPMVESSQKTESTTSQEIDDDILNADLKKGWSLNRKLGTFLLFVVVTIVLAISLIGIFIFGTKSEETVPVEIPLIQAPTNPTPSPALTPTKFGATPAPSPTGSAPQVTLSPTIAPTEFGITPNPTRTSFGPDPTRSPTFSPTDFGAAPVLPPTTLPSLSQTDSLERAIHKFLLQDNSDLLISPDSLAVQNAVNWLVDEANSTQSLIFPLNHQYLQRFGVLMLYFSIFLDERVELTEVSLPADEAVPTQDECSWRGITCNGGGMVTKIELSKRQLNGTLPSEWRLFPFLKSIDFSHNNFQGSIPEEIFGILGLKEVVLNHNQFSGTLSSKIGQLWKLTQFHASHNQLSGIPSEIKMASELKSIDISSNKLRTIPEELYDILGLEKVFLYSNEICGTISSKIGKLWDLTHFHVSNNMLSGRIPPEFGSQGVKVRQIRYFNVHRNQMTGTIPANMRLRQMFYMDLGYNQFSGTLPPDLGTEGYVRLRNLFLDHNNFEGSFPESYWTAGDGRINTVFVNDNKLSGVFPGRNATRHRIYQMTIQNNDFTSMDETACRLNLDGYLVEFKADCGICRCRGFMCRHCV